MQGMRESIKEFVKIVADTLPVADPIYEFGALQVLGRGAAADLRPCFPGKTVEYPHKAMAEVHRIVKPGGMAVISSVMNFPVHDHPSDYWRFTPEAFRSLLKAFDSSYVESAGEEDFPHTVVGIGFKGEDRTNEEFLRQIAEWKRRWFFLHGRSWRQIRRHCTPPILRGFRSHLRRYLR
jgi:SAM-dependent methyltransferase